MVILPWFAPVMWAILVLALLWFISVVGPFFWGAPWVPMPVASARRMLQLAQLKPGETVYDLGSGDGRMLIVAVREFKARAVGVEVEPLRAFLSWAAIFILGFSDSARVIRANFFNIDLKTADVVTLYLLPKAVAHLQSKLQQELKPGARVVTLNYHLTGWKPISSSDNINVYQRS